MESTNEVKQVDLSQEGSPFSGIDEVSRKFSTWDNYLEQANQQNEVDKIKHKSAIRKFQKNILLWTVVFCAIWLYCVFNVFIISLFRFDIDVLWTDEFKFNSIVKFGSSDSVMITLLSTTTANVLGALWIVMHWLYPNRNNSEE